MEKQSILIKYVKALIRKRGGSTELVNNPFFCNITSTIERNGWKEV